MACSVARGDREVGDAGLPWRPQGWRARSPVATVRAASQWSPCGAWVNLWDGLVKFIADFRRLFYFPKGTSSRKKNCKRVAPRPSKSKNVGEDDDVLITPKEEFIPHSVDPEEAERYWAAVCNKITTPLEAPFPRMLRFPGNPNSPSRTVPSYLDTIRKFCHVPDEVEFRILVPGERAEYPPKGFFTCYEVFLRCRLCFPIPEIMVGVMNHFEISISQVNPTGMQHLIGILVLSYEYGLTLVPEHFEALLKTLQSSGPFSYRLVPQPFMSIIRGYTSNSHSWSERWFFVRINSASVEESGIPIFRSEWNFGTVGNILPPFPEDLIATRNLLRSGPFFWTSFTHERETDLDMGDAVPQDVPIGDGQRKDKGIDLDDVEFSADGFSFPGWDPCFVPGHGSGTSEMPLPDCDFEHFFSNLPLGLDSYPSVDEPARSEVAAKSSRLIIEGFNVLNSALEASCQEARVFRFKAEEAERQLALLRSEASARNERLAADHAKPSAKQSAEYQQLKEAQELVGNFCECRGSVGTLWRTRESDYTFDSELKSMMDFIGDCTHADLLVPPIEGRIQELWDPIPVSPDTEEAATDCRRRRGSGSA
ncbi:hypothetical protein DY000_02016867 [Brassica cretica]|uniref:Aminotransferase-like plant mobile domain-containing protein n=1 Tax=Brassica cretica TaxID=69181 RepID=A0ABQ7CY43_BRACR|nr:hypothetical protein DY000_02016867 [Brassica cretica]